MTYSPPAYWQKRGQTFEAEAIAKGEAAVETTALMDLLDGLYFESVLELGCGFGRVGAAIISRCPDVEYTGMDVSPDLVAGARRRLPGQELICADLATFATTRTWDLVLAVSVLGHLLPADLPTVIERMHGWALRDIVTVDWAEVGASTSFQFGHDYDALYGDSVVSKAPIGRLAMYHVEP